MEYQTDSRHRHRGLHRRLRRLDRRHDLVGRQGALDRHRPPAPRLRPRHHLLRHGRHLRPRQRRDDPARGARRAPGRDRHRHQVRLRHLQLPGIAGPAGAPARLVARLHAQGPGASLKRLGTDHIDLYQLHNPRIDAIRGRRTVGRAGQGKVGGPDPRTSAPRSGPPSTCARSTRPSRRSRCAARRRRSSTTSWSSSWAGASSRPRTPTTLRCSCACPTPPACSTAPSSSETEFAPGDHRNWRVTTNERRRALAGRRPAQGRALRAPDRPQRSIGQLALQFILHEPSVASILPNIYDAEGLDDFAAYDAATPLSQSRVRRAAGPLRAQLRPRARVGRRQARSA